MAETLLHPPGTFCWHEVGVRNPDQAKQFYTSLFGWQTRDNDMGEHGVYTLLLIDGQDIGGLYSLNHEMFAGVPPHWLPYIAVADINASTEAARNLGAKINMGPMDVPDVGRMTMLQDPQGAHFALYEAGKHRGEAKLGAVPGRFCWNELATSDTAAATSFYTQLFGWKTHLQQMGPMEYTTWVLAGPVGGMMPLPAELAGAPPYWMTYVAVDGCDASAAKAVELGGSVHLQPTDLPGVGRFAVIADPDGAVFSIIQLSMADSGGQ